MITKITEKPVWGGSVDGAYVLITQRIMENGVPVDVLRRIPAANLLSGASVSVSAQKIFEITSPDELTGLSASRGDLAEIIEDGMIKNLWQCLGDPSVRIGWAELSVSTGEGADLTEILTRLEALEYIPVEITKFTVSPTTAELGSTVSPILSWQVVGNPTSTLLDNTTQLAPSGSQPIGGIRASKTWRITTTDAKGATDTKTASITFCNRIYYGVGADGVDVTSLANKVLSDSKARSITVNAGSGQYIWYAVPSRLGVCSYNVGGFDGGFSKVSTANVTNASGFTEPYDIYRSDNAGLGSTTVKIT